MEIPNITSADINVRGIEIPKVVTATEYYTSTPIAAPVVVNIGVPVVDIPGCVEAHETSPNSKTIAGDDPKGLATYCDSGLPSYNPISFEPNQIVPTRPSGVDTRQKEGDKTPPIDELPIPKTPPATAVVQCPTPGQNAKEPIGTYIEGFRKKVTEYQLIGNECVQITEAVPIPQQIIAGLPSAGTVMTTGGIAVVATASALMAKPLADILLKVIKPTVKKVMKKIAAIRGKSVPVLSVKERQDLQRERTQAIRALKSVLKPKG